MQTLIKSLLNNLETPEKFVKSILISEINFIIKMQSLLNILRIIRQ